MTRWATKQTYRLQTIRPTLKELLKSSSNSIRENDLMAPQTQRIIGTIAQLEPQEVTATGSRRLGTRSCQEILAALRDAETLHAVRALLASGNVSTHALSALISSNGTETVEIVRRVKSDA